jgi:hypothetical protein
MGVGPRLAAGPVSPPLGVGMGSDRRPSVRKTAASIHGRRLIAKLLERTGDHAQRIAVMYPIIADGKAVDGRVHHQKLNDVLSRRVATKRGEEPMALGQVVDSLTQPASCAAEIAEQAIDLAVLLSPEVA